MILSQQFASASYYRGAGFLLCLCGSRSSAMSFDPGLQILAWDYIEDVQ